MREIVKEAASVEEARRLIARELGADESAITFEVQQEPTRKVLGLFGGAPAIVKGRLAEGAETAAPVEETEKTEKPRKALNPEEISAAVAKATAYLESVLRAMGAEKFTVTATETENGCEISLEGEDLGFIIGRRGDTLDALQCLTGLVANRAGSGYFRVTLNIGNYREKREQALVSLAKRLGAQTARTGRKHSLEPMNPYERRIIHTAVQDMEGVISWSVGSDPNRHVVIGPSDDNPNKGRTDERRGGNRGGNRNRSGRGNGGRSGGRNDRGGRREHEIVAPERPVREFISRSHPLPTADGATLPSRTESEKEESATLYGRIDI